MARGPIEPDKPEDLDALWMQLNSKSDEKLDAAGSAPPSTVDTIKIKRSYEFAGQLVTYSSATSR